MHPLAQMMAAKSAGGGAEDTTGNAGPGPARPMHPLAMALAGAKGGAGTHAGPGGGSGGAEAGGEGAPPSRPMHPLAMALAGAKGGAGGGDGAGGGGGARPVHPLAAALGNRGGGGGPVPAINTAMPKGEGGAVPQVKSPEALGLPPKPKVEPPQKMKGLFWSAIPPAKVQATIWSNLNDFKAIDVAALVEDFAAKQEAAKPVAAKQEAKHVTLFDPKRNQNVLIALGRFKMQPDQIRDAVLALAENFLNAENTQKLMNILPTAEEVGTVNAFEGDTSTLGPVEHFFGSISQVPRVDLRLKCWQTTLTFDENLKQIREKILIISRGATAVRNCRGFTKILEVVLAVGNYMNGTSARGGAYGFKLDVLTKLNDVKAGNRQKGTLLNYVAQQSDAKIPETRNLVTDLMPVHEAAEHSLGQVENEIKALQISMNTIRKELEEMEALSDEVAHPFKTKLGRFMQRVERPWADTNAEFQALQALLTGVMSSFGEDLASRTDQDSCQKFFTLISNFTTGYRDALEANRKAAAEAAKKPAQATGPTSAPGAKDTGAPPAPGAKADQNLFSSFTKAQSQKSADEIVAEFRNKMQKRRARMSVMDTTQRNPEEWG
jgi:diaphanous 1